MRQEEPSPAPIESYPPFEQLCFDDSQQAFRAKSTPDLARSVAVFRFCGLRPFVRNADWLFSSATSVFGSALVNSVVKPTFFKQFCAGWPRPCTPVRLGVCGCRADLVKSSNSKAGTVSRVHSWQA